MAMKPKAYGGNDAKGKVVALAAAKKAGVKVGMGCAPKTVGKTGSKKGK